MKRNNLKFTLMPVLLGILALSGCEKPLMPENSSVASSSTDSSLVSSDSTISSDSEPQKQNVEIINGMMVVNKYNVNNYLDEFSFKIDSLNQEFTNWCGEVSLKDDTKTLFNSNSSIYVTDVNKDGFSDFIYATLDERSRKHVGTWIRIYDYHNDQELYRLDDPDVYEYNLDFDGENLIVKQYTDDYYDSDNYYFTGRLVGKGILDYSTAQITTRWQNFLNIDSFSFNVTTADPSRTPVTLKPTEEANAYIVENASPSKAYCITTNIVRNSDNYDDLPDDLPVGYRFEGKISETKASRCQDNVVVNLYRTFSTDDLAAFWETRTAYATVEATVSGHIFKVIFKFDLDNLGEEAETLVEKLGWDFAKEELGEFSAEHPADSYLGPDKEEPFIATTFPRYEEDTLYSYDLLKAPASEIDPALVDEEASSTSYVFKKKNGTKFTLRTYGGFFGCNGHFYYVLSFGNFKLALRSGETYYRFKDGIDEITLKSRYTEVSDTIVPDPAAIRFKRSSINDDKWVNYKINSTHKFTVLGNEFFVVDHRRIMLETEEFYLMFEVVSGSLF